MKLIIYVFIFLQIVSCGKNNDRQNQPSTEVGNKTAQSDKKDTDNDVDLFSDFMFQSKGSCRYGNFEFQTLEFNRIKYKPSEYYDHGEIQLNLYLKENGVAKIQVKQKEYNNIPSGTSSEIWEDKWIEFRWHKDETHKTKVIIEDLGDLDIVFFNQTTKARLSIIEKISEKLKLHNRELVSASPLGNKSVWLYGRNSKNIDECLELEKNLSN